MDNFFLLLIFHLVMQNLISFSTNGTTGVFQDYFLFFFEILETIFCHPGLLDLPPSKEMGVYYGLVLA